VNIISKMIGSSWLLILMAMFGFALPAHTRDLSSHDIAYDGLMQLKIAYDGRSLSLCDYDAASTLSANDNDSQVDGTTGIFATLPEFVAAKGTPPVNVLPSSGNKFVVDPKGNVIPLKPGETLTGSPNGKWLQVRDANGNPTGMRLDGGHKPTTHPDPRAQVPHGHVPGVTNPDGTPWLPVNQ
jgi:hypothetical protein